MLQPMSLLRSFGVLLVSELQSCRPSEAGRRPSWLISMAVHPGPPPEPEIRIPKPERSPNSEIRRREFRTGCVLRPSGFGFLSDFGLRNSDFRFRGSMREDSIGRNLCPLRGEGVAAETLGSSTGRAAFGGRSDTYSPNAGNEVRYSRIARRAPSPLKGERAGVRGEAVRLACPAPEIEAALISPAAPYISFKPHRRTGILCSRMSSSVGV